MAVAKRTVVSVLSALYLLFLTLLAAYTMHLSRLHSLPLPRALSAFTLALPLITGLLISSITTLPSSQPLLLKPNGNKSASHQPQQWQNYTLLLLTILSTVLATLNGTYLPSSPTQTCALDTKWQRTNDPENQINGRRVLSLGDGGASETEDGEARGRYLDHAGVTEDLDDSANGGGDDTAPLHSRVQPSQLRGEAAEWAGERRE
ncbi:hypothetical protein BLS_008564 [Venturia inaequalis]|uniref:Uncharacterized protein n=1 Tax=Venturia inaequalis TaxID=5025 RepID=A0A8H3YNP1_VENIN|nr:hypothetical protein BLS_008564 [Venturia inaequalis]